MQVTGATDMLIIKEAPAVWSITHPFPQPPSRVCFERFGGATTGIIHQLNVNDRYTSF